MAFVSSYNVSMQSAQYFAFVLCSKIAFSLFPRGSPSHVSLLDYVSNHWALSIDHVTSEYWSYGYQQQTRQAVLAETREYMASQGGCAPHIWPMGDSDVIYITCRLFVFKRFSIPLRRQPILSTANDDGDEDKWLRRGYFRT